MFWRIFPGSAGQARFLESCDAFLRFSEQPRLENAGIALIYCEILLDESRIQLTSIIGCESMTNWHLASGNVRAD